MLLPKLLAQAQQALILRLALLDAGYQAGLSILLVGRVARRRTVQLLVVLGCGKPVPIRRAHR